MLRFAKPIEELKNAPSHIQAAMLEWVDYGNLAVELRGDIAGKWDYPSLLAAIDRLTNRAIAYERYAKEGYTTDDAVKFVSYENEENFFSE